MLPRRFALIRHVDYTGAAGTGVIAYGVAFDDGQVVLCWSSAHRATSLLDSVEDLIAAHGHGEAASIEWIDAPPGTSDTPARQGGRRARRPTPPEHEQADPEAPTPPAAVPEPAAEPDHTTGPVPAPPAPAAASAAEPANAQPVAPRPAPQHASPEPADAAPAAHAPQAPQAPPAPAEASNTTGPVPSAPDAAPGNQPAAQPAASQPAPAAPPDAPQPGTPAAGTSPRERGRRPAEPSTGPDAAPPGPGARSPGTPSPTGQDQAPEPPAVPAPTAAASPSRPESTSRADRNGDPRSHERDADRTDRSASGRGADAERRARHEAIATQPMNADLPEEREPRRPRRAPGPPHESPRSIFEEAEAAPPPDPQPAGSNGRGPGPHDEDDTDDGSGGREENGGFFSSAPQHLETVTGLLDLPAGLNKRGRGPGSGQDAAASQRNGRHRGGE